MAESGKERQRQKSLKEKERAEQNEAQKKEGREQEREKGVDFQAQVLK